MRILRITLLGAALAALVVLLVGRRWRNAQVALEIEGLKRQNQGVATLQQENHRLIAAERARADQRRADEDELRRLRAQNASLRAELEDMTNAAAPSTEPGWKPVARWANVGTATPAATFETNLWAVVNKRPDVLLMTLDVTAAGHAKLTAYFQSLSDAERAKYPTPELMCAALMIESQKLLWTGMSVLEQRDVGPQEVVLTTKWQWADGRVRVNPRSMHLTADGWKIALPDEVIERGLAVVAGRATVDRR